MAENPISGNLTDESDVTVSFYCTAFNKLGVIIKGKKNNN